MDEEDFDFTAPENTRSRLSSLFQSENTSGDVNQALTFTAPKQPKKTDGSIQTGPGTLKLIHAAAVHAYKLKDGKYTIQGKLGCAILGHHETFIYKLLLYKGKQVQVTIASITPNFIFHVQPNNYANFYDEMKENWSINFESESALLEFTKQVILAKVNSQGKNVTSLVIQDFIKGEGQSLENGDTAEVKYTGWLLSNHVFGQVFDSNMNSDSLFRIRLGKGKVIKGLSEGMVGMQKGGRRFLVIPPNLAYGTEGMGSTIPPNSTLIFEIHIIKVKFAYESSHSPSPVKASDMGVDKKPEIPPKQSFSQEDNIKMRGASISEQLTQSPKKDKAELISRMAKMGTATLPFQGAIPAKVSSDSESETEVSQQLSVQDISSTLSSKAVNSSKPRSRTNSGPAVQAVSSSQLIQSQPQSIPDSIPFPACQSSSPKSLYAQSSMTPQSFVCAATPYSTYQHPMPGQFSVSQSLYSMHNVPSMIPPVPVNISDSHLSFFITETQNHNTEVRLTLSKITDKIDTVIQKVDDLNLQKRPSTNIPLMESSVILQNIERIIEENNHLKEDIQMKGSKIQSLNEIICDLIQRNPRLTEESSVLLEIKNEAFKMVSAQSLEKISNLEQEKSRLQSELTSAASRIDMLESEVRETDKMRCELSQELKVSQGKVKQLDSLLYDSKEKINDSQTLIHSLEEKLKSTEHERDLLSMKLQSIEDEHIKAEGSSDLVEIYKKEIQEHKSKIEELNAVIKSKVSQEELELEKQKTRKEFAEKVEVEVGTRAEEFRETVVEKAEKMLALKEEKIKSLETEIENYQLVKRKFERFQEKTKILKEMYEKQIKELTNQIKHLESTESETSSEFSIEIKKVMNRLYKLLQGKFETHMSYSGSVVLETVLQTIMGLTFQILESKKHLSLNQLSKSEVQQNHEVSHLEEESQENEINQQNLECDTDIQETAIPETPVMNSDLSNIEQENCELETQSENSKEHKESSATQMLEETDANVNNEVADVTEGESESNIQLSEPTKRDSPEICKPQPPPFFDEDDDDDDDDWLK